MSYHYYPRYSSHRSCSSFRTVCTIIIFAVLFSVATFLVGKRSESIVIQDLRQRYENQIDELQQENDYLKNRPMTWERLVQNV